MPLVNPGSNAVQTLATFAVLAVWEGEVDPGREELLELYLFEHMDEYGHGHRSKQAQWYLIDMAAQVARMQLKLIKQRSSSCASTAELT